MMHTQKTILVPHDISQTKKPVDSVLKKLNKEMTKITKENLSADAKLVKYNQILQQYKRLLRQKQEPYGLEVIGLKPPTISNEKILTGIPRRQVNQAKLLLSSVRNNPNIIIEDNGEIVIDGHKIHGSHITDLIHDFSRDSKTREPAVGAEQFAAALKRFNIPLGTIGNKSRRELFLDFSTAEEDDEENDEPSFDEQ